MQPNQPPPDLPPHVQLLGWTVDIMKGHALIAAAQLGVADELADGPRSSADLARAIGANDDFLYRLLRALSGFGVFEELEGKRFALNDVAQSLRTDAKPSIRDWLHCRGAEWLYRPWSALDQAVRSGRSGFRLTFGTGPFQYFPENPEASDLFDRAMSSVSAGKFEAVAKVFDFGGAHTVMDVGGGAGGQLIAIARQHPFIQGVVADLPSVVGHATEAISSAGLADRIRCEAIDMFESVPKGGDVYLMGHIIHDWDDERSIVILRNCAEAMNEGGRVALVEHLVPPPNTPDQALAVDLEMLVMTDGGRERRIGEFDALFEQAGLKRTRVFETGMPWRVIEAARAD